MSTESRSFLGSGVLGFMEFGGSSGGSCCPLFVALLVCKDDMKVLYTIRKHGSQGSVYMGQGFRVGSWLEEKNLDSQAPNVNIVCFSLSTLEYL